ncbi:MAG TPA: M67 family metallopeptidase [Anaeromyxobacteraceae bacterium]|nr:M67 family metallopeptidase [Anaeromyxobacteraceae bacterium]
MTPRRPPGHTVYTSRVLDRIRALAEAEPDREVCGFVVRRADGALEVAPIPNVLGRGCAPPGLPDDPARGYLADPLAHLRLAKRLRREGGGLVAAYHSHPGRDAEFSEVDREFATSGGAPLWPGLDYLVVAVRAGAAGEIRKFSWNGREFEGEALGWPPPASPVRRAP